MVHQQPLALAALEAELAATRTRGYSVDDEGVREGVVCFGAAVLGAHGQAVAGVGVCTHKAQAASPDAERHRDAVLELAHRLSLRLGGVSPSNQGSA
jgi:DNA-binding IclR family transcriptional regulator